jgi:hypothetical protein
VTRTLKHALALALVGLAGTAASAQADIAPGVYKLAPGHVSGKAVDVKNFGQSNGTAVIQNPASSQITQRWRIKETGQAGSGARFYSLSPQHAPGMCLDVAGASLRPGARVQLQSCSSARASQRWHIFQRSPGLHQITNRNSSMTLAVLGAFTSNGAALNQVTAVENPLSKHKQFKLTKLAN